MKNIKTNTHKSTLSMYMTTFSKSIHPGSNFEDKNEFLDIVYWLRQFFAILIGISWGLVPLKGLVAIVLFFLANIFLVYLYAAVFQRVDDEEYGGFGEIVKEGLMTAFSCYMVSWIIVYDYFHGSSHSV